MAKEAARKVKEERQKRKESRQKAKMEDLASKPKTYDISKDGEYLLGTRNMRKVMKDNARVERKNKGPTVQEATIVKD